MAMQREDSGSSLHSWTLVDKDQEEQSVSGSSRSSSVSGHWISSKELEDASKQQPVENVALGNITAITADTANVEVNDEMTDESDGEVVAIEEDTDDHLDGWVTAGPRQAGLRQGSLNAAYDDDECSMGESDTSSHSDWQVPLISTVRQRRVPRTPSGELDGGGGTEEEALPVDYPAGYAPTVRTYVHRRNEEVNRGLTVYVVMMAVLVALLAVGHFGGTRIVTRHAHYGVPVDVAHNMRHSMGVMSKDEVGRNGQQDQQAELFLKLHQMMKTQGELKRRISALEEENRALRYRLADSRKLLTRIVHKGPVFNTSHHDKTPSWSKRASPSATAGWTLSDIVHLHPPKEEDALPHNFHRLQRSALSSVLANKSSLQLPSRPTLTKVACNKPPSKSPEAPPSPFLLQLRNNTRWKSQVENIKRDLYRVKERYQEVNRSHHRPAFPASPAKQEGAKVQPKEGSKYGHCGLGGTLYNDYCYLTLNKYRQADNQPGCKQKLQPQVKIDRAGWYWKTHDPLRLWHTLQHLSRTKKMKKALKKWTYDLVSVSSPFLKETIAHVPKTLLASRDWVSCQWKWWQKAVQSGSGGVYSPHCGQHGNSSPRYRDDGWRPKCKDGQCNMYRRRSQEVLEESQKHQKKEKRILSQGQSEKTVEAFGEADWYAQRATERAQYRLTQVKQWKDSNLTLTSWLFERARSRQVQREEEIADGYKWLFERARERQVQREQEMASDYNETPTRQEAIPADPIYAFLKHRAAARALNRYP